MTKWYISLLALLILPVSAWAQTGTVRGTVTDAETGEPLPGVNITITEIQQGAATGVEGTYEIAGVPAGTYDIEARFVGFRTATESVTVSADETVEQNFTLRPDLLELDEVVVTGQGTSVERRKLAANVDVINATDIEEAPVTSIDQLLQGRVAGSTVRMQSAQPGQGAVVNFRGITSFSASQTPVIYVDGVRVDNSSNTSFSFGGESTSALSDLLTSDIERIEVTKGGAASTLYGSDAANGVIQIFTKRGQEGAPRITFRTEQGASFPVTKFLRDTGFSFPETRENPESPDFGRTNFIADEFLQTGTHQDYYVGVSGGSETVRYFASGKVQHGTGIQPNNDNTTYALRGNVQTSLADNLNIRFSGNYTRSNFSRLSNGTAIADPLTMLEVGDAKFFTGTDNLQDALDIALLPSIKEGVDRFTVSTQASYQPSELFNTSLTIGIDSRTNEQRALDPATADILTGNTDGGLTRYNRDFKSITLEYIGTIRYPREGRITSEFTFGVQGFREEESIVWAEAETFALPGTEDIGEAGNITADEAREQVFNGGFFFREQIGLDDLLFLNLGLRLDGNSAFGDEVGLQTYPRAGLAYTISDAPFWGGTLGNVINELKLRTSYGQTGKFPDPFVKDVTFQATPFRGASAPRFGNPGNEELKPERTSTWEFGLDGSVLSSRLGVGFTYYQETTKDALVEIPEQPATGQGLQFRNIGELQNQGIELSANARILTSRDVRWTLGGSWGWNKNEVTDLGGAADFNTGGSSVRAQQRVTEGEPIGIWRPTVPFDSNDDGLLDSSEFRFIDETPYPTQTGSFNTNITLFQNILVRALADWATGAQVFDWGSHWASFNGLVRAPRPAKYDLEGDLVDEDGDGEQDLFSTTEAGSALLVDGDYLKLREVTVSYNLPGSLIQQLGMRSGSVYLTGRNLLLFTRQDLVDPELAGLTDTEGLELGGEQSITLSPPRQMRFGIEVTF
jgi:TonB-linked SusC/RagA family outer membrane protein